MNLYKPLQIYKELLFTIKAVTYKKLIKIYIYASEYFLSYTTKENNFNTSEQFIWVILIQTNEHPYLIMKMSRSLTY